MISVKGGMIMEKERHHYLIKSENHISFQNPFHYKYGSTSVEICVAKRGFQIEYERPKLVMDLVSDDLFQDAIKKVELLGLILYSKRIKYSSITATVDDSETCLFSTDDNNCFLYTMISEQLRSPMSEKWSDDEVINTLLYTTKSSYDRRFSSLFAFLLAKSKAYESEKFFYLWMSMNGLYGHMAEKHPEIIQKEWRQIKLVASFYEFNYDSRDKIDNKQKINKNRIRGKITEIIETMDSNQLLDTISAVKENKWDNDLLEDVKSVLDEELGESLMDPMGFFLFWYPYQLRCKYFHGEKSIPIMSFPNERPLPALKFVNVLLEDFLDAELHRWFNEKLCCNKLIPLLETTIV